MPWYDGVIDPQAGGPTGPAGGWGWPTGAEPRQGLPDGWTPPPRQEPGPSDPNYHGGYSGPATTPVAGTSPNWGGWGDPSAGLAQPWYDPGSKTYQTATGSTPWYSFAGPQASQGWTASGMANPTTNQMLLYNSNPDLVDRQLGNWLAPNQASPFRQYVDARAPQMQKDWAIASADNPNLQYSEYQHQHFGDLINGFGGLSAAGRGENPGAFGNGIAGRNVAR